MSASSPSQRYTNVAVSLHWTIAALIFTNLILGFSAAWSSDPAIHRSLLDLHKPCGLLILLLSLARVAWRSTHTPPATPPLTSKWERQAKSVVHCALYVLMMLIPLTGWLLSSAVPHRHPIMLGGSIAAPFLPVSQSMALAAKLHATHECLAISMVVLLAIHLGAVAKHHLIYRDQLLRRMSFSSD